MKTIKTKATTKTLASELDFLSDLEVDSATKDKIKDEVGTYLIEQTLLDVAETKSPVTGSKFDPLSKKYKAFKQEDGRGGLANLELTGDMLEELSYRKTNSGIEIGYFNTKEALKADGHNNFTGKSSLPQRQFLPMEGQSYRQTIVRAVDQIIKDELISSSPITRSDLAPIGDKKSLFSFLKETYPTLTTQQIKANIKRNQFLVSLLSEFDLLRFLD